MAASVAGAITRLLLQLQVNKWTYAQRLGLLFICTTLNQSNLLVLLRTTTKSEKKICFLIIFWTLYWRKMTGALVARKLTQKTLHSASLPWCSGCSPQIPDVICHNQPVVLLIQVAQCAVSLATSLCGKHGCRWLAENKTKLQAECIIIILIKFLEELLHLVVSCPLSHLQTWFKNTIFKAFWNQSTVNVCEWIFFSIIYKCSWF
jgi:hypothetical protein